MLRFGAPMRRTFCTSRRTLQLKDIVTEPYFFNKEQLIPQGSAHGSIPAFRVLDQSGAVLEGVPQGIVDALDATPKDTLLRMYTSMSFLTAMDNILNSSQRQGRISFYMTSFGEEGSVVGSAAAWNHTDEVFAQYRETGVLVYRGVPLSTLMAQLFATHKDDTTKGRQMPIHYGSKDAHFHTISSPLATQVPQAVGAGYALKRANGERAKDAVICYMGEGATSEGDFHAGMNMASVLEVPIIFFVRNNGFAISTPASEQYKGDGIVSRGPGYGIESVRVDGNDPLAVYHVCSVAREKAVSGQRPILIEAMSYRVGHHSTSDESSAYRSKDEVEKIRKMDSPTNRLKEYLVSKGYWDAGEQEEQMKKEHRRLILEAFSDAAKDKSPALQNMFTDVYKDLERPLKEQKEQLEGLIKKYGEIYPPWKKALEKFE